MRKTKLFFVACWALMLALNAHATTSNNDSNTESSAGANKNPILTRSEMRGMLIQMLVSQKIYNLENAVAYVHSLKTEEVQALLETMLIDSSNGNDSDAKKELIYLKLRSDIGQGIMPSPAGPKGI